MRLSRRSGDSERGVAMVEFALILPILAMLLVGVIEFGFAFKDKLLVDNAIQVAARTGASLGQADDVDLRVLEALEQGFAGLPSKGDGVVLQAQVYRVNPNGSTDATKVNTYKFNYSDVPSTCHWDPCPSDSGAHGTWKPADRDTKLDGGLDSIGVRVFYGHPWIIGTPFFIGDVPCDVSSSCWTETAIMRLEPKE